VARKGYWVQWLDDRWKVRYSQQTLSTHTTKPPAIDAGVTVAKANQPSELFICDKNGTIEDRRTYGDDPYPPAG
jgi:hypothetical protein